MFVGAEEHDVGRRLHVADFSRGFALSLILVAREIRAAGAGAKRAER